MLHLLLPPPSTQTQAQQTQADSPWPEVSSTELDSLLKELKLTTPSESADSRAAVPSDLVHLERNRLGMPDPATKRANPIDQYSDLLCGTQVRLHAVQCSTVQDSTVQCSTVPCRAVQHSAV